MGCEVLEAGLLAPTGKECCVDPASLLTAPQPWLCLGIPAPYIMLNR